MKSFYLDPFKETADTDVSNNSLPRVPQKSKFQVYKDKKQRWGASPGKNPMQKSKEK